jgi:anti-sigma regulatory factor (Ser/Thr protein kinase)
MQDTDYSATFPGTLDQLAKVRAEVGAAVSGCPRADDVVLIASELAANAIMHSLSGAFGQTFTVRAHRYPGYVWVEVEDQGGLWLPGEQDDRPHGLDLVAALVGDDGNWLIESLTDGCRVVSAKIMI